MENNPLVSFWIPVYNQEKFVKESVESALAQTYSPLEIIISDDCSSDNSYEIIKETIKDYNGPHKIILNRNPVNLGIGGQQNLERELVHGEFITGCGGDDIALPNKTEMMVKRWLLSGKKKCLFFSNAIIMDENGNEGDLYFKTPPRYSSSIADFLNDKRSRLAKILEPSVWVLGATSGVSREIWERFDEMSPKIMQEDAITSFRSLLLGGMEYIDEPLVKYRIHQNSVSSKSNYRSVALLLSREYYYVRQQIDDAKKMSTPNEVMKELKKNLVIAFMKRIVFSIPYINVAVVSIIKSWNKRRKK